MKYDHLPVEEREQHRWNDMSDYMGSKITLEELNAREKGATMTDPSVGFAGHPHGEPADREEDQIQVSTLNGDVPCADCGTDKNIIWYTDDLLWNNVCRPEGYTHDPILCIECFVKRVEAAGYRPHAWRLILTGSPVHIPVDEVSKA